MADSGAPAVVGGIMSTDIATELKEQVCASIELAPSGLDRFLVETPFLLPGGDHVPVVLERSPEGWRLTDDGETFMQLSLLLPNFDRGNRRKFIEAVLASHQVENRQGTLVLAIPDERYADALTSFVQAVIEVIDVRRWTWEAVRETFRQDAQQFVTNIRPNSRVDFRDPERDPEGHYEVDILIPAPSKDVVVMLVSNDDQCREATIVLHQWEKWQRQFESVVLFRDEEDIARRPRAQLGDIAGKSFSSLAAARDRLPGWLDERTA